MSDKESHITQPLCESCGKRGEDVEYRINPYDEDVNGIERWQWLCDACYHEYLMDI